jgi:hypothetical protein
VRSLFRIMRFEIFFQVSVGPHQRDVYVVFITELTICLCSSFLLIELDAHVFPVCTVDTSEFTSLLWDRISRAPFQIEIFCGKFTRVLGRIVF